MRRTWYLISLVPILLGAAIGAVAVTRMIDRIEAMPRLVAPGERSFDLPAGEHIVYAESSSVVDGVRYENDKFRVKCGLTASDGTPVELHSYDGKLRYSLGGFTGGAIFTFQLGAPGNVTLRCEPDAGKAVIAIGGSIGATIVVMVVSLLFGLGSAIAVFFVIRRRRKRYLALVAARDNRPG